MAFFDDDLDRLDGDDDLVFNLDEVDDGDGLGMDDGLGGDGLGMDTDGLIEDVVDELPPPPSTEGERIGLGGQGVIKAGMKLNVDVTVVLDVTGSMTDMINSIKANVLNFRALVYERLNEKLKSKRPDRLLDRMRVRVVAFRDYNYDWEAANQPWHGPMLSSEFCDLDDEVERDQLKQFVDKLEATGGVDAPESSLEAIHYAINSDWDRSETSKHRHVIMVFTDAPALPLDDDRNATNSHYPTDADMPRSLSELYAEYAGKMGEKFPRLLLFAPQNEYPWSEMSQWTGASLIPVNPDGGLSDVAMESVIAMLTGSL